MTSNDTALIASLLQQALAHHQQGQLGAAQAFYRQVLALQPQQFDALHLQLPGQGVQGAVEHFEAEYAADLSTGQGRVGQYDLAGAIAAIAMAYLFF